MRRFSSICLISLIAIVPFAGLCASGISTQEATVVGVINREAPAAVVLLEKIVNMNSGTFNPAGVVSVGKILELELQNLGFKTRWIAMDAVHRAPSLVGEHRGKRGKKKLLLIGHMDTVFEPTSPFQKFVRSGDTATGPGVADMKGGIVVMLSALRALKESSALKATNIVVFITGDEEAAGEPVETSRAQFVEAGKNSDAVLSFETGIRIDGKDYASTARRGAALWELRVQGISAHQAAFFLKLRETVRYLD